MLRVYYTVLHILISLRELWVIIPRPSLWKMYLFFQFEYFFFSPYYYADKTAKDDDVFGYSPLYLYQRLFKNISRRINGWERVTFIDAGCGDGRGALFAAQYYQIRVFAVDQNVRMIKKLEWLKSILRLSKLTVINASFFDLSWSECDIIFCAWSTFREETKQKMVEKMKQELAYGTYIVTLTDPIIDQDFNILESFGSLASWGRTGVFIHHYQPVQ